MIYTADDVHTLLHSNRVRLTEQQAGIVLSHALRKNEVEHVTLEGDTARDSNVLSSIRIVTRGRWSKAETLRRMQ